MTKPMDKINEFAETHAQLQKRMREEGEQAVAAAFKQVLEENPLVKRVEWQQYTPYFNDGDECVFGVGEPEVNEVYSWYIDLEKYHDSKKHKYVKEEVDSSIRAFLGDEVDVENVTDEFIADYLNQLDTVREAAQTITHQQDLMRYAFGDHASIVVTPDGITVDEYTDHH